MSDWVTDIIRSTGYAGIIFLMLIENVFPPIPSEIIMPLAGYLVSQEQLQFALVVLAGMVGSVLGALPLYYLGHKLGAERLKHWCDRYGRWFVITRKDIDKTQRWFDRYGIWTVLLLRLVPGVRSLISIPAGISKMSLWPFLLFTAIGTAIWSAFLAYLGLVLGQNFSAASDYIGPISTAVIVAMTLWYVWRVWRGPEKSGKTG
ncbi:DedA family protein [Gilvimarinus japonicus]|jgi:membrane protein DedA with SNARE-associated domain|uniref:DedA family protein n=1 Tax=Gilvimarinus japonicus TaxID=1796469 RepID=A0ABV7HK32_9GAMM